MSNPTGTSRLGSRPFRLWVEWMHYYIEDSPVPGVVMKDHQVFDMNLTAWIKGVAKGMRKHQVQPLVPQCQYIPWKPNPKRAQAWLDLCVPYSGVIEPVEEHSCVVDLSGHPDPLDVALRLVERLSGRHYGVLKTGAGPSKWLAQLASRNGEPLQTMGQPERFLSPLSVHDLLPVPLSHRERLEFLGYSRIGQLAQVPLSVLKAQFGADGVVVAQAAKGAWTDSVRPLYPPNAIRETMAFTEPLVDGQLVAKVYIELAEKVAARLDGRQAGRATVEIVEEEGEPQAFSRTFKRPVVDKAGVKASVLALVSLAKPVTSGVLRVSVCLDALEPARSQQTTIVFDKVQRNEETHLLALKHSLGAASVIKASEIRQQRRLLVLKEWCRATGWK